MKNGFWAQYQSIGIQALPISWDSCQYQFPFTRPNPLPIFSPPSSPPPHKATVMSPLTWGHRGGGWLKDVPGPGRDKWLLGSHSPTSALSSGLRTQIWALAHTLPSARPSSCCLTSNVCGSSPWLLVTHWAFVINIVFIYLRHKFFLKS